MASSTARPATGRAVPPARGRITVHWGRQAVAVVFVAGAFPLAFTAFSADSYLLAFPLDYFVLMLRLNPIGLVFPLLAAVIYVLPFGDLVRQRFLTYTRPRVSIRVTIGRAYGACALTTGLTFVALVALLYGASLLDPPRYRPDAYGGVPYTPSTFATFSEVAALGDWMYAVVIAAWFATQGVCYAWLALSATVLSGNRLLGLSLPWIAYAVAMFALAVLDLAAYSPATVTPFNMVQLPWWKPMVPFAVLAAVSGSSAIFVVWSSPVLSRFQ